MPETPIRFVVKRLHWSPYYVAYLTRSPGETAVVSFPTFDEASADCHRREEEARKRVNPFKCGTAVNHVTHFDEPRLRDWLMDHGVELPPFGKDGYVAWMKWWDKNHKKLSTEKIAAVWEALDRVRFYSIVRPVGYAIVKIDWQYNDEYYIAASDGGKVMKVYRSRERAEAECARRNSEESQKWGSLGDDPGEAFDPDVDSVSFDMQDRLQFRRGVLENDGLARGEGLFATSAGVSFFEVIEVELEGLG